jgi:hypothetical protein
MSSIHLNWGLRHWSRLLFVLVLVLLLAPGASFAGDSPASAVSNGDNAWMLISTGLVLMMTAPGLTCPPARFNYGHDSDHREISLR